MNIWYETLNTPPFTPPQIYFPIAWTVLYSLMAISFVIVLLSKNYHNKNKAIVLFFVQLFFNLIWTYLFFDLKVMNWALIDLFLLLITLIFTMKYFCKISKWAMILLIPYLIQVIFAIYLNAGFIIYNK